MTPRSIRRAAERKARKEMERKARHQMQSNKLPHDADLAEKSDSPEPAFAPLQRHTVEPCPEPKLHRTKPVSEARLAANQANAQLSTGPKSCEGKSTSSMNAVKIALTGRTVLLPSDDAALYEQHVLAYAKELSPLTQRECDLVQSIADTAWRLKRIPALEMAIYAQGRVEFAEDFNDHSPAARPSLIELKTFLTYEKQLRNLQLQEARLHRRYSKDTAELRTIQAERQVRERADLEACGKLYLAAKHDGRSFHPSDYGFEISIEDVMSYLEGVRAAQIDQATNAKRLAQAA